MDRNRVDILFVIFCLVVSFYYSVHISIIKAPVHDGAIYLLNARSWLQNTPLVEEFRPQLLSWLTSAIWLFTGENWILVKYLQAIFTISAGIILYVLLRKYKGVLFAFGVTILTMLNTIVFSISTQILTEGVALFFLVLTLYLLKNENKRYWFFAGMAIGLTFAARYPIFLQALVILIVESLILRKPKLAINAVVGMVFVMLIVVLAIYIKSGTFTTSLGQDSNFTIFLSSYYLTNSIDIWGFAFLLVPLAFLFRKTYSDKFNYAFIAWFVFSMVFWSANATNFQYRFTFQFTPAVYFLGILAISNFYSFFKDYIEGIKVEK